MTGEGSTDEPVLVAEEGACRLEHHERSAVPRGAPPVQLDAGELRVTGGSKQLVAVYDDGYEFPPETAIFETGDVLTFDIEGSDRVAAMSVSIPAPPAPVITPPPETIDTGEDLTFTWTSAPGAGAMDIRVWGYWPAVDTSTGKAWPGRDVVTCEVEPSQGTLTMPASLLSQVVTESAVGVSVGAFVSIRERRAFGDSFVGFHLNTTAVTPSGQAYLLSSKLK